ncbi:glycosyltransferase family 4 protein [Chryseobacterium balustinum]|uniref:D-inositol-3-phosphate glycosyltransferase n=1 Tax=Chryseobacterium balustinum TaxID=246 RepID=A0AAX2IRP9_9FLAO|nr:glycosyltransferase family 4 protein [Chryseobacterium balustinum]AZB28264.1 glycosyltransferase [Chryseobacterium balustinum]SKB90057.1 Glycosyltransferase involved in cell wall bisynthesis [Chryseobacterium balustinum]SQA92304.1 D-inositol-3-phosphate glycosyltransferase [Chryseobacterium balustinum]
MRIAFLSIFALDANVSLINALKQNNDVYFFTEALYEIFNYLDKNKLNKTISKGTEVDQLERFQDLIDLDKTFVIKGTRNSNVIKKLYISYQIHQYLKKIKPDVIIIDNCMLTYFVSTLAFRKKMLLVVHDPFLHSGENLFVDRVLRKIHFSLIQQKMLLNENQKNEFISYYNYNPKDIHTSFLSVYDFLNYFKTNESVESGNFNILFFGRISPYKGIKFLLDAFVGILLTKKYTDITLTIAGSGDFDFDIEPYKKYPEIKIINEFIIPENLANLIFKSSVVVCPYIDATQSGVVMSAYAFKKPVIATNVGGLPEMVKDQLTGIIIEPKNSEAIRNAILELYNNSDLLETMSQNIEKLYFSGEKSWASSANRFIEAFENIK